MQAIWSLNGGDYLSKKQGEIRPLIISFATVADAHTVADAYTADDAYTVADVYTVAVARTVADAYTVADIYSGANPITDLDRQAVCMILA